MNLKSFFWGVSTTASESVLYTLSLAVVLTPQKIKKAFRIYKIKSSIELRVIVKTL